MFFLGVDIGGTKTDVGIVDETGAVVAQARAFTPAAEGGERVLESSIQLARKLVAGFSGTVSAVGIGCGGQIDANRGIVVSSTDLLPGWAGQQISAGFTQELKIPAFVDNDVNALAVGEHCFGAALGKTLAAFLALGTGVGGAIIANSKLLHGAHWSGGEFGQMVIDSRDDARIDASGHKGTLEAYASGPGLVETWRQITGERREMTGEQIATEARIDCGSPEALAVTKTGHYLGFGLVTVVSLFDPEIIVIGGGLASLGELLLSPARAILKERALPGPAACPVIAAALGAHSSVVGAAAVAMERFGKR